MARVLMSLLAICCFGSAGAFGAPIGARGAAARSVRPHLGAAPAGALARRPEPATAVSMSAMSVLSSLRGGAGVVEGLRSGTLTVGSLYNGSFGVLACLCLVVQVLIRAGSTPESRASSALAPAERSLRNRFLAVFWLYKMADWLQGPYFYDVYASKLIGGLPVSADGVAKLFLAGFGTTMLVGPFVGSLVDSLGRKKASLAFALAYTLGALSTATGSLPLLYAGRFCGGVGTSLLFSAPEAWLISESKARGFGGNLLSQTFGLAYLGDSVVAMVAGQLAGGAAAARGPVAPFVLSTAFLAAGAALVAMTWQENYGRSADDARAPAGGAGAAKAGGAADSAATASGGGELLGRVGAAWRAILADRRVMLLGAMQASFEGAMYTFVLVWPPALKAAVAAAVPAAAASGVPFGAVFSCFMACCMLGSSAFAAASKRGVAVEKIAVAMLAVGATSMGLATAAVARSALLSVSLAFFAFEACVGARCARRTLWGGLRWDRMGWDRVGSDWIG
jgi:MFS family permease